MQPLPFADNFILAPMQIWLVVRISQLYGRSMEQDAALKLIGTLGFGFMAQHATVLLYKLVPGMTFALGPFTVFGFTVLLGAATAMLYERGRLPDKAEQKDLLNAIKSLLKDKELVEHLRALGQVVTDGVKAKGYKVRAEDIRTIMASVGEQGRPIGERLNAALFQNPHDKS